jgi:hypothetical protein
MAREKFRGQNVKHVLGLDKTAKGEAAAVVVVQRWASPRHSYQHGRVGILALEARDYGDVASSLCEASSSLP